MFRIASVTASDERTSVCNLRELSSTAGFDREILHFSISEGLPLSNTTFPHIVPLITLLERDTALPDNPEPWENLDDGVEVVMAHLEAARMVAHHGGLYHTNAEVKLQGKEAHMGQYSSQNMSPEVTPAQ